MRDKLRVYSYAGSLLVSVTHTATSQYHPDCRQQHEADSG